MFARCCVSLERQNRRSPFARLGGPLHHPSDWEVHTKYGTTLSLPLNHHEHLRSVDVCKGVSEPPLNPGIYDFRVNALGGLCPKQDTSGPAPLRTGCAEIGRILKDMLRAKRGVTMNPQRMSRKEAATLYGKNKTVGTVRSKHLWVLYGRSGKRNPSCKWCGGVEWEVRGKPCVELQQQVRADLIRETRAKWAKPEPFLERP